ncbi:class I SAM-dependent methyltransferase [Fibrella sp. HMF5335]|uniref:Class I SAM-dependent methyltransferase n=1 Tax=Fibrella rubiginis TaxID=2817060 RepID=A0A939K1U2_9BACT|nr:class I SAM-dependent methyltransferase [Fibrella rubiginis]MBO0937507.1 class I SAM-dependent methyltransferase [Fibrella rubiginis]
MLWYTDFFHGLPQEAWRAAQSAEQTQHELELLVETLEFGPGDRVLDVFCGYGRHAIPLARMGTDVTGVDISAESIAELRQEAKQKKVPLVALEGDFTSFDPTALGEPGSFRAAYCLGNSFCFFPRPQMQAFLQRVADYLEPGGRWLAHSNMVAESFLPDFQEFAWLPVGDTLRVLAEHQYDPLNSMVEQRLTYYRHVDKTVETAQRTAHYYIYTIAELLSMMALAGLQTLACYGTVEGDEYKVGDEGIWIIAQKEG